MNGKRRSAWSVDKGPASAAGFPGVEERGDANEDQPTCKPIRNRVTGLFGRACADIRGDAGRGETRRATILCAERRRSRVAAAADLPLPRLSAMSAGRGGSERQLRGEHRLRGYRAAGPAR